MRERETLIMPTCNWLNGDMYVFVCVTLEISIVLCDKFFFCSELRQTSVEGFRRI